MLGTLPWFSPSEALAEEAATGSNLVKDLPTFLESNSHTSLSWLQSPPSLEELAHLTFKFHPSSSPQCLAEDRKRSAFQEEAYKQPAALWGNESGLSEGSFPAFRPFPLAHISLRVHPFRGLRAVTPQSVTISCACPSLVAVPHSDCPPYPPLPQHPCLFSPRTLRCTEG